MIGLLSGNLDPDKDPNPSYLIGSEIGGREFVKAMLRWLPPGEVGCVAAGSLVEQARAELRRLQDNEGGNYASAVVFAEGDLSSAAGDGAISGLHDSQGPFLHRLSHIRRHIIKHPVPLTCLTHGFSYQHALWDMFARLLLTPTCPYDAVICTSRAATRAFQSVLAYVAEELVRAGLPAARPGFRVETVPLGIDTELYRPRDRGDARRILGLPHAKTLLLYFGRIDPSSKGDISPLLAAFHSITQAFPNQASLVLAGGIPDHAADVVRGAVERSGCADNVILRRQPTAIEGPLYYAAADIFVSISETLQESFGITPLEAMASGLPAVVSDWSGYRDTVVHGQTGFLVRTRWAACDEEISLYSPLREWSDDHLLLGQTVAVDTEDLRARLMALVGNVALRSQMGAAARTHVEAEFAWKHVARRVLGLWQELVAIALSHPDADARRLGFCMPRFFEHFQHYASCVLSGEERVELSDAGRRAAKQANLLLIHPRMRSALSVPALMAFLKLAGLTGALRRPLTVNAICHEIAPRNGLERHQALAHVMWLLKHDLLRIAKG